MGRSPCCAKEGLNRGAWSSVEDKTLTDFINTHGEGRWRSLPKRAGLKRCGKSCRLRWLNYLRPDIVRGNISQDEEELIIRLHKLLGNRWSLIAGRLPGRTDNEIKNYWNTNLCKRLSNLSSPVNKNYSKLKPSPSPASILPPPPPPPPATAIKTKAMRFSSKGPFFNKYHHPPPPPPTLEINNDTIMINNNNNNNNPSTALDFSTPDSDNFGFLPDDDAAAAAAAADDLMLDMDQQMADFRFSDLFVNDFSAASYNFDFSLINFPETTANYVVEDDDNDDEDGNLELNWVLD